MLCVTDVYLRDITNNFCCCCNFVLECKSSEHLLLLFSHNCKLLSFSFFFFFFWGGHTLVIILFCLQDCTSAFIGNERKSLMLLILSHLLSLGQRTLNGVLWMVYMYPVLSNSPACFHGKKKRILNAVYGMCGMIWSNLLFYESSLECRVQYMSHETSNYAEP